MTIEENYCLPADHWFSSLAEQLRMMRSHLLQVLMMHLSLLIHLHMHPQSP